MLAPGFQAGIIDTSTPPEPPPTLVGNYLTGTEIQLFAGDYMARDGGGGVSPAVMIGGSGNQTLVGAAGDSLVGGSGNQVLDGTAGFVTLTPGTGSSSVFGGVGDRVLGNAAATASSTAQIVASAGAMSVVIGAAGRYTVASGVGDTITAAAGNADIMVAGAVGDLVDLSGTTGRTVIDARAIDARAGGETITGGGGATTVYGGVGDQITAGPSGSTYVDGQLGGMVIKAGAGGTNTIIGAITAAPGNPDTIIGGGADLEVQGVGRGDVLDLAGETGTVRLNATAGDVRVTLGGGASTVFGGAGDTVAIGSGSAYVDGSAGGMTILLGSGGVDSVFGAAVAGAGDTITGGGADLDFNPGSTVGGGNLIDLSGKIGNATINAFRVDGIDIPAPNDTIIAGGGNTAVYAGNRDRVAVGTSGTAQFDHSTTVAGAAIGFGTNSSIGSAAAATVTGFAEIGGAATDYIFYPNESGAQSATIVASAAAVLIGGVASTRLVLPDGSVMTLVGVPKADFNTSFFKP